MSSSYQGTRTGGRQAVSGGGLRSKAAISPSPTPGRSLHRVGNGLSSSASYALASNTGGVGGVGNGGGVGSSNQTEVTPEQKGEIDDAFQIFNATGKGELDFHQLKVAMRALGFDVPKSEVVNILTRYDKRTGAAGSLIGRVIRREDFHREMAHRILSRDPEDEIRRAFSLFSNGKDTIDAADLERVSHELSENISEDELRAMIDEFDLDGKGSVNFDEFKAIMHDGRD